MTISHRFLVRVLPSGQVRVRLVCPAGSPGGCAGTVAFTSRFGGSRTVAYSLAAGQARVLRLVGSAKLVAFLKKHPRAKLIPLSVTVTNAPEGATRTDTQRTIHVAPRRRHGT